VSLFTFEVRLPECYVRLPFLDFHPDPLYTKNMKNTKLSPAQAYAAQVKADRRARALENRESVIAADNARVNAMFPAAPKATPVAAKKRIEDKLHYRYMVKDIEFLNRFAEVNEGEVPAWVIIRQEQVRALDKFQPVLGRQDTSRRNQFVALEEGMLTLAADLGRVVDFNWEALHNGLKDEFQDKYNEAWAVNGNGIAGLTIFPVLDDEAAVAFRNFVRPHIEAATVEIFRTSQAA
jgi:hypothetical protein